MATTQAEDRAGSAAGRTRGWTRLAHVGQAIVGDELHSTSQLERSARAEHRGADDDDPFPQVEEQRTDREDYRDSHANQPQHNAEVESNSPSIKLTPSV